MDSAMTNDVRVMVDEPESHIEGVKPQVARGVYEMLKSGRRYFGSSGAAMSHEAADPEFIEKHKTIKEKAKEFLEGEHDTTKLLKQWMKKHPGVVLVDSTRTPYSDSIDDLTASEETGILDNSDDTDHLLFFGSDVIAINTKRWKAKKRFSVNSSNHGEIFMTEKPFPGGETNITDVTSKWEEYLDGAFVIGIICVNNDETTVTRNRSWYEVSGFRLVENARLEQFLDEVIEENHPNGIETIDSSRIAQAVVRCIKPYDPRSSVLDMKQINQFR